MWYIIDYIAIPVTYDHRLKNIGHPVRSAILKLQIDGLVVGWVTTSEFPLLYVNFFLFFFFWSLWVASGRQGKDFFSWRLFIYISLDIVRM